LVVLTLLQKIYGSEEAGARKILSDILSTFTSGLEAEATFIGKNTRNWIQVEVTGTDTNVAINYLRRRFGLASPFTGISAPKILKGKIVDSGKVGYGLYVDIETYTSSSSDALIPLHTLRSHLVDGKKLPLREIIDTFCLYDNFPLSIRLTKVNLETNRMWAEPSDEQIEMFRTDLGEIKNNMNKFMAKFKESSADQQFYKDDLKNLNLHISKFSNRLDDLPKIINDTMEEKLEEKFNQKLGESSVENMNLKKTPVIEKSEETEKT